MNMYLQATDMKIDLVLKSHFFVAFYEIEYEYPDSTSPQTSVSVSLDRAQTAF